MRQPDDRTPHFHTRRQVLLGITALAALSACGGRSGAASVTDRQVAAAPDVSLHVRDWPSAKGSGKPLPTGADTYAPTTLVADLLAVLDALHIKRIILAGHSIAGNELTLFAGSHPQRVRGLAYLDTTWDYLALGGHEEPTPSSLDEPQPGPADLASMAASINFAKRLNKQWWPALEANWRDSLDVLPGGAVRPNAPPAIATAMHMAAHNLSPDYRRVRAPALVITVDPGSLRNLFPWLLQADPATLAAAQEQLDFFRPLRLADGERLAAALPGSKHLLIHNGFHGDFFIEHESTVVDAIEAMRWEGLQ